MKKDLGVKPYVFPMPVLLISTYNADNTVDVMNMAWGGVCGSKMVALNIDEAEAERFDAAFPPKVKLKLPGQLSE